VDAERLCEGCGKPLPASARPNRHHHSHACQKRAYRRRQREREAAAAERAVGSFGLRPEQEAALAAATSEPRLLALVAREAPTNWRAAAWMLERRYPERWGLRPRRLEDVEPAPDPSDPFAEVDELAARRRRPRPE
jgi:hypothetical protein